MQRKTITALIVFLMLLGGVYWLMRRPEKGQRTAVQTRPLLPITKGSVQAVSLASKDRTVVLNRTGDGWKLTKPVEYPADKYAVDSLIDKLEKLEFGDMVTDQQSRHAEYEVDEKRALHVVAEGGGKVLADFYLGKAVDDFTMLRPAKKDQVYQAVGSLRFVFDREVKNWRRRTIVEFKQDDALKLEVQGSEGTIVLSRPEAKKPWKVDSSSTPIDKLDESAVSSLLATLYSLSAFDFADGESLQKAGLDKPGARVTATLKSGPPVTVLIGGHLADDYRVQRQGSPQIFLCKKYSVDNLLKRPIDFRDKTIWSFKAAEVTAFSLEKKKDKEAVKLTLKGSEWLADGKKAKEQPRIKTALDVLATLKAEGFGSRSAEEMGLNKPDWVLEVQLKDKSKLRLTVGSAERDGVYGVTRKGSPDLYTLRKWSLDRFLLEPKSLRP